MKRSYEDDDDSLHDDEFGDSQGKLKDEYLNIVSAMMYSFGDVKEPKKESVEVMYSIVREQVNVMLEEAQSATTLRGGSEISHEDILFLLRKNKVKLRQMLQYLEVLDMKPSLINDVKLPEVDVPRSVGKKKRVNMCMEYLSSIEDCKEFTSLLKDKALKMPKCVRQRLERRNWMVERMKINEYEKFSETLRKSFCPAQRMREFKQWLLQDQVKKLNVSKLASIMIGFLIREIIAEIVDRVLLNKLKIHHKNSNNPFSLFYNCDNEININHVNISEKELCILSRVNSIDEIMEIDEHICKNLYDSNDISNISTGDLSIKNFEPENDQKDISFSNATSNKQNINFSNASNKENDISFSNATNKENDISFSNATNKEQIDISFSNATSKEQNEQFAFNIEGNTNSDPASNDIPEVSSPQDLSDGTDSNWNIVDEASFSSTCSADESSNDKISDCKEKNEPQPQNVNGSHSFSGLSLSDDFQSNNVVSEEIPISTDFADSENIEQNDENKYENSEESCIQKESIVKIKVVPDAQDMGNVPDAQDMGNSSNVDVMIEDKESSNDWNTSGAKNHPKVLKEDPDAITPEQIREAFMDYNNISPLVHYFTNLPLHYRHKFILAEAYEDD